MKRILLFALVAVLAIPGCGTMCADQFDPGNPAQVDGLAAKVQPAATLAAAALAVELSPSDMAQLTSVLQEVRTCVAGNPTRAANVDAIAALVIDKVTADPARQAQYARLVHAATVVVVAYVPSPPPGSTAATVLAYATVAQRLTLAAIDGALAALPAQPAAAPSQTGGAQ